jgi:hypothetical protein
VLSSDLQGVNPTTLNKILLYYRLMTKRSGLGDSTELSRMGLSQGCSQGRAGQGAAGRGHGAGRLCRGAADEALVLPG